jgi:hypothetical protein
MKKFAVVLSVVIGAWMLSPTPEADAMSSDRWARGHNHHASQSRAGVPELDPSAAGSAMILLLGGVAYISSRRREDDLV